MWPASVPDFSFQKRTRAVQKSCDRGIRKTGLEDTGRGRISAAVQRNRAKSVTHSGKNAPVGGISRQKHPNMSGSLLPLPGQKEPCGRGRGQL